MTKQLRLSACDLLVEAQLGDLIYFTDGKVLPSTAGNVRTESWRRNNFHGILVSKQTEDPDLVPPRFTLHLGDYPATGSVVTRRFQTHHPSSKLTFAIEPPPCGIYLCCERSPLGPRLTEVTRDPSRARAWHAASPSGVVVLAGKNGARSVAFGVLDTSSTIIHQPLTLFSSWVAMIWDQVAREYQPRRRTVVGRANGASWVIQTDGESYNKVYRPADAVALRDFDQRNFVARLESNVLHAAAKAKDAALDADREDLNGFEETLPSARRATVVSILSRSAGLNEGPIASRRDAVRQRITAGWRVEAHSIDGRRFVAPDGRFYPERLLTKTALDYATYLIALSHSA